MGREEVYDVRIPGPNAFDGNGLVLHNCGEQPLPLWRLPARLGQPGEAGGRSVHARGPLRPCGAGGDRAGRHPADGQCRRRLALPAAGAGGRGQGQAAHRPRRHRPGRRLPDARRALWLARLRRPDRGVAGGDPAAFLPRLGRDRGGEGGLPAVRPRRVPGRAGRRRAAAGDPRPDRPARHPQRAADLDRADRHHLAVAGNVASGIEPVFAWTHTRNVLLPDGSRRAETVENFAYRLFREIHGADAALPEYFVDAQTLEPADHLAIQAAAQKHIDSSISKTINCPEDLSFDAVQGHLRPGLCAGLQGLHHLPAERDHRRGAGGQASKAAGRGGARPTPPASALPAARPEVLPGETYKLRWPDSDHAIYVTLNDDGGRRPAAGPSRSSSTRRTWSTTPGPWR